MKTLRVFLAIFATLLLFFSPPAPAFGEVENYKLYLPMISVPCPPPTLYTPEDNAQLDTLIPTFNFEVPNVPRVTGAGLDISANPSFMPMAYAITSFSGGGVFTWKIYSNLEPASTYYWRAETKCGDSAHTYSEVRTFITGSGGVILPAPVLISPPDGSTTDSNVVTFEWSPVDGADSYLLNYQAELSSWMSVPLTGTQITRNLLSDRYYTWYVQALNAYGMGIISPFWNFSTP